MTTRHEDQPTAEMSAAELSVLLGDADRMRYAPDVPHVIDLTDQQSIDLTAPQAIDAAAAEVSIDAAAAEVSIDLPLDDDGTNAGFVAEPVDPRFVQRRDSVNRSLRRSRLRKLALIFGAPVVGAGAMIATYSPLLDIDRIDIIGSDALTFDELAAVGGLSVGDPMLWTNLGDVAAKLDADPRFERVAIDRNWPNGVTIRATERRAITSLVGPTRSVIVGEGGIVMREATADDFIGRISMETDIDTEVGKRLPDALAATVDVLARLPLSVGWNVSESLITAEGELIFTMNDGVVVVFGTVEDAEEKIQSVVTMLTSNVDRRGMCRVDVRVPSAPTVRREPNCELPARPRDVAAALAAEQAQGAQNPVDAGVGAPTDGAQPQPDVAAEGAVVPPVPDPATPGTNTAPAADNPGSEGILAPPEAAATATGANREPGADGAQ